MNYTTLGLLLASCTALLILERLGVRTTLALTFKGDVKRETRFLAQYGQSVCTAIAVALVWATETEPQRRQIVVALAGAVFWASVASFLLKRLFGRIRPGRENAGAFLGPSWKHANYRESFPSSHSACAVALTTVLALAYPPAAIIFWVLALTCGGLRYILDAHWPSDVLAGISLGYVMGWIAWITVMQYRWFDWLPIPLWTLGR